MNVIMEYGLQALMAMPQIMRMVREAVEAVEEIGGTGTGQAKKLAVMEAVEAAYDVTISLKPEMIAIIPKAILMTLAGNMVEIVLKLKEAEPQSVVGQG